MYDNTNGDNFNTGQPNINNISNNKKKTVLIIIAVILVQISVAFIYVYIRYYSDILEKTNDNFVRDTSCYINEDDSSNDLEKGLAILTSKKIDNFSNLDFSNRLEVSTYDNQFNFNILNDKIVFQSDVCSEKELVSNEIKNIESIRVTCHCGGCNSLYYITTDKKLYSVNLDSGCMYLDEETNSLPSKLIARDAASLAITDSSAYEYGTCGGEEAIYKSTNGKTYAIYGEEEIQKYNINNYQNKFVYAEGKEGLELNVIYKDNATEVWNEDSVVYVKDSNGNKLYAKNIFYGYPENCFEKYSEEELSSILFVITEDDKIYFLPKGSFYNNANAYLFSNKTVKSIEDVSNEEVNKVKINYIDNTYEEIKTSYKLSEYDF